MKGSKYFWLDIIFNGSPFFGSVPVCRRPKSSEFWCEDEAVNVRNHYDRAIDFEREDLNSTPELQEAQAAYERFEEAVGAAAKRMAKLPYGSSTNIKVGSDSIRLTKAKRDECGRSYDKHD